MRSVKGSMTVEAALILPLLLALFGVALSAGLTICEECRGTATGIRDEQEPDTVKKFYLWKELGEIAEDGDTIY